MPLEAAAWKVLRFNAQVVNQQFLRTDHVADGDNRKIQPPRLSRFLVKSLRPGGAHAAAEYIGANDKITVGVDHLARTDHLFPPAALAGHGVFARNEVIARQCMADQYGIGPVRVELAPGLIGDIDALKLDPVIQTQRLLFRQTHALTRQRPRTGGIGWVDVIG